MSGDLRVAPGDPLVEVTQAVDQDLQRRARRVGRGAVFGTGEPGQAARVPSPLRDGLPELGQMAPERVDLPPPLPDRQLAHPEHRCRALLLLALDRPYAMLGRRAASQMAAASAASPFCRRTNGFTPGSSPEAGHSRRDQADLMAQLADPAAPEMRPAARLHRHRAAWEPGRHLTAA
jgi:hypothetical protein